MYPYPYPPVPCLQPVQVPKPLTITNVRGNPSLGDGEMWIGEAAGMPKQNLLDNLKIPVRIMQVEFKHESPFFLSPLSFLFFLTFEFGFISLFNHFSFHHEFQLHLLTVLFLVLF